MPDQLPDLPELFDLDYGDFAGDLPLYERLARDAGGLVLELAVGTGRATVALARAGIDAWGIDTSEAALERARRNASDVAERVRLQSADMRDFDLGQQFGLIFAGYGAFHHLLTPDDQLACLCCVQRHLAPDGVFVCDLRPLEFTDWEEGDSAPLLHDWTKTLPRTGETVLKLRAVRIDTAGQLQHETHIYDIVSPDGTLRRVTAEIDLRFTSLEEMEGLLGEAGLALERVAGDYDLSPYNDRSDYMIVIARHPAKDSP